ncbi:MAG: right-handed parallel beta-helix repeat-containing protein [Oscillospiraceae bacterium]|jgi:hypothetical protein|nr:right-handed parallel beta-helix repeat-containing protein [Oscillospiraceae bacterium]
MKRKIFKSALTFLCAAAIAGTAVSVLHTEPPAVAAAAPAHLNFDVYRWGNIVSDADFYVAVDGNDKNDGLFASPFASIERARDAVRAMDKTGKSGITVAIMPGNYRVSGLVFTKEDSGTQDCPVTYCNYGGGEVVINGGVVLEPGDFVPVSDEAVLARLDKTAREQIVCVDLKRYGLTGRDWGGINAIGQYHTASQYEENKTGPIYCELFYNGQAMSLARYPDEGWLYTGKVLEQGEGKERAGDRLYRNPDWDTAKNPKGDTYKISGGLAKRMASWQTLEDVWMFGFFMYDWADASTPIGAFDAKSRTLQNRYVSLFGAKEGAPYYFFNVLEELDHEGEFYLDRASGMLYLYRGTGFEFAQIDLSLTTDNIVRVDGANHLTFSGLTFQGTRGDALVFKGDDNRVENCLIQNVAGWGLRMEGCRNTAQGNEITQTGKGSIFFDGGDKETLTPSENTAIYNLIHHWSRIYQTYQPAVSLNGVGAVCKNNEMHDSPHEAIQYGGNNHLIEYNRIYDVCLLSDDAGAVYSGRHWDWYGTVIRYNSIYNLGSGEHKPCGIYMDDALSGQTIYGNLLVNVPGIALHMGGGRDIVLKNNIVINSGTPISYDERAREGAKEADSPWTEHFGEGGDVWEWLLASPWQNDAWQKAFPAYARFSSDFNDTDSPNFVPNAAFSDVSLNLIFDDEESLGKIAESVYVFSTVEKNGIYALTQMNDLFTAPGSGHYTLKSGAAVPAGFEAIPFDLIGRFPSDSAE